MSLRSRSQDLLRTGSLLDAGDTQGLHLFESRLDALEIDYIRALVEAADPAPVISSGAAAGKIVKSVEDIAAALGGKPVGILELCRELRIAERTLHAAFHQSVNTSPAAWLRGNRLNLAYKALRQQSPQRAVAKSVALQYGFSHYGRFAQQNRDLFDELPSETLARM